MKISSPIHVRVSETKKQDVKKEEDPFDLDLKVSTRAQRTLEVNDPTTYCGSDDDCTGCGCNTCCSSC